MRMNMLFRCFVVFYTFQLATSDCEVAVARSNTSNTLALPSESLVWVLCDEGYTSSFGPLFSIACDGASVWVPQPPDACSGPKKSVEWVVVFSAFERVISVLFAQRAHALCSQSPTATLWTQRAKPWTLPMCRARLASTQVLGARGR